MIGGVKQVGLLIDVTRCNGCNQCVEACTTENRLKKDDTGGAVIKGLSGQRFSAIALSPEGGFVRQMCRHCLQAACVSVCPVGAMYRSPEGVVLYDAQKCMGCRYCMMACPYGIPRYEWDAAAPLVRKCGLCTQRLQSGQLPACVEACPNQVMVFGEREALLEEAHNRLASQPDRYLPVVTGEHDAGGSAVLYISHVSLDFLSLNRPPGAQPLPELSHNWLGKVPGLALTTGSLMTGLFWVIGRRMQFEEARLRKNPQDSGRPE
jgi:formate dehydrogenase iron-sulfur subunit